MHIYIYIHVNVKAELPPGVLYILLLHLQHHTWVVACKPIGKGGAWRRTYFNPVTNSWVSGIPSFEGRYFAVCVGGSGGRAANLVEQRFSLLQLFYRRNEIRDVRVGSSQSLGREEQVLHGLDGGFVSSIILVARF